MPFITWVRKSNMDANTPFELGILEHFLQNHCLNLPTNKGREALIGHRTISQYFHFCFTVFQISMH